MSVKGLVLAGGFSERMGRTKALIEFEGISFVERAFTKLSQHIDQVFISLRNDQVQEFDFLDRSKILTDRLEDIGPAAALLRAYEEYPTSTWLILACDFIAVDDLSVKLLLAQLMESKEADVICFRNELGILEPLFAVWQPSALRKLKENVQNGSSGPQFTLSTVQVKELRSAGSNILLNINYPADFEKFVNSKSIGFFKF